MSRFLNLNIIIKIVRVWFLKNKIVMQTGKPFPFVSENIKIKHPVVISIIITIRYKNLSTIASNTYMN